MSPTAQRPLGKITALLADLGLEVTYAYDDLVFIQHSVFLLQFTDENHILKLFTNRDCEPVEANEIASSIVLAFHDAGLITHPSGYYILSQNEDATLKLEFA